MPLKKIELHSSLWKSCDELRGGIRRFAAPYASSISDRIGQVSMPAAFKPKRVACLHQGFVGNDKLKSNAVQAMKRNGVTSFPIV